MSTLILTFSPDEAYPGQSVEIETEKILNHEGQDSSVQGALWVSAKSGASIRAPEAIIEDTEAYSQFTVMIPESLKPDKYSLQMYVRIGDEILNYDSLGTTLSVTASGGEDEAYITRIMPSRASLEDIKNTRFLVSGRNLDTIRIWSIMSSPSNISLVSIGSGSGDIVNLRPSIIPSGVLPGRYKIRGRSDEGQTLSPVSITLE